MIKEAFFHESNYCQIELQPVENRQFIQEELKAIEKFSDENLAEDGIGWKDIFIGRKPSVSLADKQISLLAFDQMMSKSALKFDKVFTVDGGSPEECHNVVGYGTDDVKVFVEHQNDIINTIWFDYFLKNEAIVQTVYQYVKAISDEFDLLFVDWAWGYEVQVKQTPNFLQILTEQYQQIQKNRLKI